MKKTIVIDAGHGGKDRANRGYSGKYIEADGNLQFALFLHNYLKDYFNTFLTRKEDITLSLKQRGLMAKDADMFLSIHSDAYSKDSSGVTVFDSVDLHNEGIGAKIGKAIADAMGIPFKGIRERESQKYKGEDYYTVIDTAQDIGCPVVLLIERGFHSNPHEEQLLLNDEIVKNSAKAAAEIIKKYYGVAEEVPKAQEHFAEKHYRNLINKGIIIHDKRFDDPITRGELFALLSQIVK